MATAVHSFRDLIVWQKGMALTKEIYRLSKHFPMDERFALTNQIRRAAVSIPSNIAEGHARQGREFCSFLSIARGSLAEVETQLLLAVELDYLNSDEIEVAMALADEVKRMAAVLAKRISSS